MAAGIRISQLPTITAMTDDDVLIVNDGDTSTRKITYANFAAAIAAGATAVTSVNGQTGAVTITANDLSVYTKSEVDSAVAAKASNVLLGVSDGASDMGTFVGSAISANVSVKNALQELETAVEAGDAGDAILAGNNTFTGTNDFQGVITAGQNANVISFYFADQASFPSAATYHGAVAHSHADGKMFFAHGGGWVALANGSEVFSGAYGDLTGAPTLGTASAEDVAYFATAAQGTAASTALQPGDIGVSVQGYNAGTVVDANYNNVQAGAALGDTAVQPADIGTAAAEDVGYFATAAQGTKADGAISLADLKSTVAASSDFADFQTRVAAL